MERTLDVYLHRHLVGQLLQDDHGQMFFDYAQAWLDHPRAVPLSHSLPLSKKHFARAGCRAFFAGVLPEESQREIIARNLGISAKNDFAMLERLGGECAGAVTFLPKGVVLPAGEDHYRDLSPNELAKILRILPRRPLMAGEEGIRLSLAGVQDKMAVRVQGNSISVPLAGAPSTHILKPAFERFEGTVFNEAFCMQLAAAIGLPTAAVELGQVEGIDYLLVQRYDRKISAGPDPRLRREHQEDFCQALGIVPENKYQNEGGPSLKQCFDLIREISSAPVIDLQALLDAVIFNFLIGNHDAHGKNFSILYGGNNQTRLAPFYDLISTSYYPELAPKMAMKIGSEYLSAKVAPQDFERLAGEAQLAKRMVRPRVGEIAQTVLAKLPAMPTDHATSAAVATLIRRNCERALKNFAASAR